MNAVLFVVTTAVVTFAIVELVEQWRAWHPRTISANRGSSVVQRHQDPHGRA